jgi:hypothetical protein
MIRSLRRPTVLTKPPGSTTVVDHQLTIVLSSSILRWLNIAAPEKNGGGLVSALRKVG